MGMTLRGTATAVLLSATVLGLTAGLSACAVHEQAAPPGAGQSQSFGMPAPGAGGSGVTAPAQADAQHNQADVAFVNSVVLLRQQAVQLGYLGKSNATDAKLKTLSGTFSTEQYPALDTLIGWLGQWGAPSPSPTATPVSGLLSPADLQQLQGLKGSAFDTKLVADLLANHQAVLAAVNTELSTGSNPQAKQVAQVLGSGEQAEINQLNALGTQG